MRHLWTAAVLAAASLYAPVAMAQDKEQEMWKESVNEKLNDLQGRTKFLPDPAGKDVPMSGLFNGGVRFKSADGNFEGALSGRMYVNGRAVIDSSEARYGTNTNDFFVRTARLYVDGTFYKDFYYRVESEYSNTGSFFLKDGYLAYKGIKDISLLFGQFKEPFSQEENTSSRFIDFAERSVLNRLAPAHDVGIGASGVHFDKMFSWELGVFNGAGRSARDTNDEKDIAGRVRLSPFVTNENEWLKQLRIGVAFTYGDIDTTSQGDITSAYSGVKSIDFDATHVRDGIQTRIGIELSWLVGPFSLRGEYVMMNSEANEGAIEDDIEWSAYYLQVTYLLTGEAKTLENRIKPKESFSLSKGTWGAFELAFRIASIEADGAFDSGYLSAQNESVQQITFGINWWMTQNFRLMLNYNHEIYDEDFVVGADTFDTDQCVYFRLQIDW